MNSDILILAPLMFAAAVLMVATVAISVSALVAQASRNRIRPWRGILGSYLGRQAALLDLTSAPGAPTAGPGQRRAQKRFRTCMMGSLHTKSETRADNLGDVINLSAGGARIRLVEPMPKVSHITLGLRHFGFFPARVAWCTADEIGLEFREAPEAVAGRLRGLLPQPVPMVVQ